MLLYCCNPPILAYSFVTSGMASLSEEATHTTPAEARLPKFQPGWPKLGLDVNGSAYRVTKAALNMAFLNWVRIFEPDGVKCFSISPGILATNLMGNAEALRKAGAEDPSLGGEFIRDVMEGKRDEDKGKVIRALFGDLAQLSPKAQPLMK